MGTVTSERRFYAAIFQHKMEQSEIEREITQKEKQFRKLDKCGKVSAMFDVQDELGVLYKRLMKIWRIKHGR